MSATLHEFQVALLRRLLKGFPAGDIEDIVRAISAYEPNKKEISRLFELSNKRGEKLKVLLEAAKRAADYINNISNIDPDEEDEEIKRILNKAIAEGEES